jgi:hypothetical protein
MMDDALFRRDGLRHFEEARRQARWHELAARLAGRQYHLLPFEAIRNRLRQQNPLYRGIQQIPLEQIVGSVGRYLEFSRTFLPLNNSLRERWANIDALAMVRGWPPIEVYQIGTGYFVKDGHHRVSVARQMANQLIEAHVYEFPAAVEINPDDSLDDVLIRLGERRFMEQTALDELYPDHGIRLTIPGQYSELMAQIEELRDKLSQIDGEAMGLANAVEAWYEMIYLPTVQIIHDASLLADMPGRTESDLFVWLSRHREGLEEAYGHLSLEELAKQLAEQYRPGSLGRMARSFRRLLGRDEPTPLAGI